jgi:hypothetical protein
MEKSVAKYYYNNRTISLYKGIYNMTQAIGREYDGITEFKNDLNTRDIKIWMYTMPVRDLNKKHNENYKVLKKLKQLNKYNDKIVFNEYIIGSFDEIINWGEEKYIKSEYRTINLDIQTERKTLERLLIEDIKNNVNTSIYYPEKNKPEITMKNLIFKNNNLTIKRKIIFDVNIEENSDIIIGFTLKHAFDYINTLDKEINNITKGEKVKDYYNNCTYTFKGIAPFTISEENEYLNQSIIDYYKEKGEEYITSKLNPETKAILVEDKNGKTLPYISNRLKKVCTTDKLESGAVKECNKHTKLKAHDRMKISIDTSIDILKSAKYIKFDKKNMLIKSLGYKKNTLDKPKFLFGNEKVHNTILYGLPQHGSYEQSKIEISYFIDPEISKNNIILKKVINFSEELEKFSKSIGVEIDRVLTKTKFKDIRTQNKDIFESDLREIVEMYKNPVIVIMEDSNTEKYYGLVKKIFGNKNNIATQFISLSTLNYNEKNKNAILLNILLGVYGKSGIQPWVLQKPLNADCYIGLDVSREKNLNTAGIIQVIGKDGRVLRSKSVTSSQSGEKINIETIKEIFHEANYSYKKIYKKSPKHIVFHRDGISREELDLLKETANNLGINFEYVEITKDIKRRIAQFNVKDNVWETQIGTCYLKNDKAYLVTTSPFAKLGMAQPVRVRKIYGNQSIEEIVEDVYRLSFMHIGSILKARLPVTTHYADLSSTHGNREYMPSNIDSNSLHFL